MITHLHAKKSGFLGFVLVLVLFLLQGGEAMGQKYWRGGQGGNTKNDWYTRENWSPIGVPTASDSVVIGDSGFNGVNDPIVSDWSDIEIKSLTIGGSVDVKFYLSCRSIKINKFLTVKSKGTFENNGTYATYGGSFNVETGGVYIESAYSTNNGVSLNNKEWATSEFTGVGVINLPSTSSATGRSFSKLIISGTVKLGSNLFLSPQVSYKHNNSSNDVRAIQPAELIVKSGGTLNPESFKVTFATTGPNNTAISPAFSVEESGTILVKTLNFSDNYSVFPTLLNPLGTVNYARSTGVSTAPGHQNILPSKAYGILRISGDGTKILLSASGDSTTVRSNLFVDSGTLDIARRSLNRPTSSTTGGTMNVANGATFKLSGGSTTTTNFPANFTTIDLGPTSTTEYYGRDQMVQAVKYGHLILTAPDAVLPASNKIMIATNQLTVSGNLSVLQDAYFLATNDVQVDGNVTIKDNASFNGGAGKLQPDNTVSFTHTIGGNWLNDADFTGNKSIVKFVGTGKKITRTTKTVAESKKNEFNDLVIAGLGTTIEIPTIIDGEAQTLSIRGHLSTNGAGTLTQNSGSLTMEGSAKVISGSGITLNHFIANGTTATSTSFTVKGNFTVNGGKSFIASGGTITMAGSGANTITNVTSNAIGNLTFFGLRIDAKTLTSSSFYIDSDLSGNDLTAETAGTVEFRGTTASFAGVHNLFNVVVSGTDRRMVTNSNMGVASTLSVTGLLNVTSNTPNTVTYNGSGSGILVSGKREQTVAKILYHNITFDKDRPKLAEEGLRVNGDMYIKDQSNFNGVNFSHILYGNWINDGTARTKNSRFIFANEPGKIRDVSISGTPDTITVLKTLVINKSTSSVVPQGFNIITDSLGLNQGSISTGSNKIVVNKGRTGDGWVIGTIQRYVDAGYVAGAEYFFNGKYVSVSFGSIQVPFKSVTMTSILGAVPGFSPGILPINRMYKVEVENGAQYTNAKLKLQYQDSELNGNTEKDDEEGLQPARSGNGNSPWTMEVKIPKVGNINDGNDSDLNWVAAIITNSINNHWTLAAKSTLFKWKGDVSHEWRDKSNWREVTDTGLIPATRYPGTIDIAEIGGLRKGTKYVDPIIEYSERVKGVIFGHVTSAVLTIEKDSLYVRGNLAAVGDSVMTHKIEGKDKTLVVNGNLILDQGNHAITLNKSAGGYIRVNNSIIQKEGTINLSSGILKIKGDYSFSDAAEKFSSDIAGSVIYDGGNAQVVASVGYGNLIIDKADGGVARLVTNNSPYLKGSLKVLNGKFNIQRSGSNGQGKLTIDGDLIVETSGTLESANTDVTLKGNWVKKGVFTSGEGTVRLLGSATQLISGTLLEFDNLEIGTLNAISAASNIAEAKNNVKINGSLKLFGGTLNMGSFQINRGAAGGEFKMSEFTTLLLDASNFPSNYNDVNLDARSTVIYQGESVQEIAAVTYGNLTTKNGNTSQKTITGPTAIKGNLTINDGSTLNGNSQTITLSGNFDVSGTFTPGFYDEANQIPPSGTIILASTGGVPKTISGKVGSVIPVNNFIVQPLANYSLKNNLTIQGNIDIVGNGRVYERNQDGTPVIGADKKPKPDAINNGILDAGKTEVSVSGNFRNAGILLAGGAAKFIGKRPQTISLDAPILPSGTDYPNVEFAGDVSPILNSLAPPQFAHVTISNRAGVTTSVNWTTLLTFTVTPDAEFNGGPYTHSFQTAIFNKGVINSSGIINFTPSGLAQLEGYPLEFGTFNSDGTLILGGAHQIVLAGSTPPNLKNLIISNTAGIITTTIDKKGVYVLSFTDWNLSGNLLIEKGGVLNAVPYVPNTTLLGTNFFIGGDIVNNGTILSLNPADKTSLGIGANFTIKGVNSKISGSGTTLLGNLTVLELAGLAIEKNISLYSNLNHNGKSFSAPNSTVSFVGPYPSMVTAKDRQLVSLSNLRVLKDTDASTVYLKTNLDRVLNINVDKGILDLEENVVTALMDDVDGSVSYVSTLSVIDNATIKVGGTSTLPEMDVTALTPVSNTVYYGSAQEVKNVQYGNLKLENIPGDNTEKTFLPELGTTKIAGNFTKTISSSRVITPKRIEYNGGDQEVAELNYKYLKLTNSGTTGVTKHFGPTPAGGGGTVTISKALVVDPNITVDARRFDNETVSYIGDTTQVVYDTDYFHLKLSGTGNKTFRSTPNVVIGIAGDFESTTSGTVTTDNTTIDFDGARAQKIAAVDYDNLHFTKKGVKTVTGDKVAVNIKRDLKVIAPVDETTVQSTTSTSAADVIEVRTGTNRFVLSQASGTISESENAYVTGTVETNKSLSAEAGKSFAGMGITINPVSAPNITTKVTRVTGEPIKNSTGTSPASNRSILRYFIVEPESGNAKLNATVEISYFDHELNGYEEEDLIGYFSELYWEDTHWNPYWSSVNAHADNKVTLPGIDRLGRYTLRPPNSPSPFPVEMISFTATRKGSDAVLNWAVASEENNSGFEVQASTDGKEYQKIGFVKSRVGTTSIRQDYSFTDNRSNKYGTVYYRLKQIDLDGKASIYGPRDVNFGKVTGQELTAYPNPFGKEFKAKLVTPQPVKATIKLHDAIGQQIFVKEEQLHVGENTFELSTGANIPSGMYILSVEMGGEIHKLKLMKQ